MDCRRRQAKMCKIVGKLITGIIGTTVSQYGKSILLKSILHSCIPVDTAIPVHNYIRICPQSFVDIFTLVGDIAEVICTLMFAFLDAFKLLLKEHMVDT